MIRFFSGLAIGVFFFTKIDILIWQRIFETNGLVQLGVGTYHQGWTYALYGFMALGVIFFYPHYRRMIMFPLSLVLLAFCGLEDVLYYWLDGRAIPMMLPWLNSNFLIIKPVTSGNLLLSAAIWVTFVIFLEIMGERLDRKVSKMKISTILRPENILARVAPRWAGKKAPDSEIMALITNPHTIVPDPLGIGMENSPISKVESGG